MTKKHFKIIAEWMILLRTEYNMSETDMTWFLDDVMSDLKSCNPLFDKGKFLSYYEKGIWQQ